MHEKKSRGVFFRGTNEGESVEQTRTRRNCRDDLLTGALELTHEDTSALCEHKTRSYTTGGAL